jgi:tetratricopeptide (TPR) repeat protein
LAAKHYLAKYSLGDHRNDLSQDEVGDNLKAHHYLMTANDTDQAAEVVYGIQGTLMKWARYSQLFSLIKMALESPQTHITIPLTPWFEFYQGRIFYIQGKVEGAREVFQKLSKYTGHDVCVESIQMLADIDLREQKPDEALRLLESNLSLFKGREGKLERLFDKMGRIHIEKGEPDKAIPIYKRLLDWQEAANNKVGAAIAFRQLAIIYASKGDFPAAHQFLNWGQPLATQAGDKRLEGWMEGARGEVYDQAGDTAKAIECYERSLATSIEIDNQIEIKPLAEKLIRLYQLQNNVQRIAALSSLINQLNAGTPTG